MPNAISVLVRVSVTDNGTPSLTGSGRSAAAFAIQRASGDVVGPRVVAGSIVVSPNPVLNQAAAALNATVSDANHGGGNVVAAEWSYGDIAAPAGAGHAMTGSFGAVTVPVSAALTTGSFSIGAHQLFVRGQDAAGNWGPAAPLAVVVNGVQPTAVDGVPANLELRQSVPNPAFSRATIGFALPQRGAIDLAIFDVQGRRVRTLLHGDLGAGVHAASWDRIDESGNRIRAGIYYYRLVALGRSLQRRMVLLH